MTIDTLGYVKKLEAAGMDRRLAEAHAEAMNEKVLPKLATSHDMRQLNGEMETLRTSISADIRQIQATFTSELRQIRNEFDTLMWKHTVAVIFAVIAIGGFLVRFVK